ncbi:MAG: histidinol-phosphate transaminase [Thermodesulfobacteriota bacterium]|nr:histidinol-phosphate transaminase [Thermodesulfobacteriota bacterium]
MKKSRLEKGGFPLEGINLALCENPLPPIDEAIERAKKEIHLGNHYTEPYSWKLKERISDYVKVPVENIHINAGSELILRQLFLLYGQRAHLISPTYYLFEEIAEKKTCTFLAEKEDFLFNMKKLEIPKDTTVAVIVNPNNPTGTVFNIKENLSLIERHPDTIFLIDEAFIEFGGNTAADLIFEYKNVIVTRTFSKALSLAGFRVGYAIAGKELISYLNNHNDAYPLARPAEAAAIASLEHLDKINARVVMLKDLTKDFAKSLQNLGITTYPTETYFFLGKIPYVSADEFAKVLSEKNIHIRPLHQEGLGNNFLRFATSTSENNRIVLDTIREIFENL